MSTKRRQRHSPEQVVRLRDVDAMLNAGQELSAVLQPLEVSESTYARWRNRYDGMKAAEAVQLKKLEWKWWPS